MRIQEYNDSKYIVRKAKVIRTEQLTNLEKWFELAFENGTSLDHEPGQFVTVSLFGIGEVPISITSSPTKLGSFELTVRAVGKVTRAIHRLQPGDSVGIRGPFGKGFPVSVFEGNDLLFIAGGLGIVPLRSLINYVIDNRRDFGRVIILYGCKEPKEFLYCNELDVWKQRLDILFDCTVDRGDERWKGNVGVITTLIPKVEFDPNKTYAVVVGPPVMYKFVLQELKKKNMPDDHIYLSLERHMKCGLGKCGHCQIENYYCCQDGPVFRYDQIKNLEGAI